MAQVSYGTITITDTNDIESIIIEYARNQSTSSAPDSQTGGWSTTRPAWAQGYYIWQRARIHKSGTNTSEDEFGTAVCVTGSTGQTGAAGRGLTATETKYTNVESGTTQVQVEALAESAWVNNVPSYNSSKPDYWVRIKNTYDKAPTTEYIYYKDNAVGDALAAAAMANSLAQSANENANGAMGQAASNVNSVTRLWWSQATATPVPSISTIITDGAANRRGAWSNIRPTDDEAYPYYFYCDQTITGGGVASWSTVTLDTSTLSKYEINSLNVRTKNFFKGLDNSYDGWFASGRAENEGLATNNAETYHYNARFAATHIALGYNKTPIIDLDGGSGAINIYRFPTINSNTGLVTTAGALGMKLSATDLIFYKPPVGNNSPVAAATLNANGLVLSEGGIKAGTSRTNGFIYLSSTNFADTISGHSAGTVSLDNYTATDWRQLIGTKFGVRADGTLYANNAIISGTITATSLTIGSGATVDGLSTSNISGMNNYALQSSLDTEVAERKAIYAISTTGATTSAKTTESGTPSGFVLYNGATVTVKFNSANSTSTPTLNVNGTGAKTIKSYTGAALSAAEYTWPAGAAITFTYDGSYWRMQDSGALQAKADAAASASAASSSASAASTSASSASTSASNASSSASSASTSASTASAKATEASNSASTASSEASAASTSATNAANSASAASTSATNASNSADAAASSASNASDSADAAAGSASTASSKATAAADSATSASNSASSASSSATSASNSASSASSSAATATNQANAAAGSATAASNSATAASGSATAASNSATAASNSATAASNSATAASNSATAAAEVMGGFTILWNYSAFGTSTAGDAFICGFDPATGTKSDANGWVKWNGTKRTITKQQVNPGTIVPYNIPIYIVCRLSSATSTTGTNYMVWYNSGWKYAACPSPTAIGGSWMWTDNRDIILGSFVETGADEVLTECELFNPPWTSKQITTNTTTPTSYIMDTDSNRGITVKPKDSSGNDFLQMNSTAIEFFRNSTTASAMRLTDDSFRLGLEANNHTTIDTNGLHIWTGTENTATNEVALFSSTARIGKTNSSRFLLNADSLQAYNSSNQLYFEVSDEELKTSLTEAKDVFTVGYGSAIANKTETRILNSTSGVLDLTTIPFNTNFNLTFTVFFVGYSVTLGQSTTFENEKLHSSDGFAWNSIQAAVWREVTGYSGELLPSGSMELSIRQPTPGEKQINYNITITGTGLTFDYATITAVWEESAAVKDQVFLTFGSREDGISKGLFSSAMGLKVAAIGDYSYAEGYHTIASGNYSHASGFGTQAIGDYSYSSGYGTKATIDYQTVFGKYNLEDSEAMFIVGNGTNDNNRSNLMSISDNLINIGNITTSHLQLDYHSLQMIDKEGSPYFYVSDLRDINGIATLKQPFEVTYAMYDEHGEVPCNVSNIIEIIDILDEDGDSLDGEATATYDSIHNRFNVSFRSNSYKGDICNIVFTTTSTQTKAFTFGTRNSNYSIGGYSAVLGYNCAATNTYSIAEGRLTRSEGYASHAEGQYSRAFGRASHAEGTGILGSTTYPYTFAYGEASHAEGCGSKAFGKASHAEGDGTVAGADASHAEGVRTQANKRGAHAEGEETIANGLSSHASGYCTNATGDYQTVIGLYNETNSNCAFIIGNGALGGPSNALTVDWYGNMVIPNGAVYRSKNSSGDERPLCGITNSNGYFYGYGSYNNNEGTSYFDGNNVKIRSNNNIDITGPVYTSSNIVLPNNISLRGKTANGNNNYSLIYASDSNNLIIGNSSWNDCYIYRVYTSGSGTVSTVPNVRILDSGRLTRTTHANSSIKIKHDIKDIENKELDPHRLYGVEVKQFIYNDDVITDKNDCRYHKEIAGFIAEQLHECYPIAVDINEKGECEAWQAQYIIPPMLKLIQEQHEEIEQLKKEVAELKNK